MLVNRITELKRPSAEFPRQYVPVDQDVSEWQNIEPLYQELLDRPINSKDELEKWLFDQEEVGAVIGEESSRRSIIMTCNTEDKEAEAAYLHYVENIFPKLKPIGFEMLKKFVACPYIEELDPAKYDIVVRSAKNAIELYREENIALETELSKLSQQYQKLSGSITVFFKGEERTMQQMNLFYQEKDRALREEAYRASTERRMQESEKFEELFNKMLKLRVQIAKNAGFDDYRAYMFKAMERFDYTPEHCTQFHKAVEELVMPINRKSVEDRKQALGIDSVRPWDTACDIFGRDPLHPFTNSTELAEGCQKIFHQVDPELGANFQRMIDTGLLDLDSRKGKAPGGYQASLNEVRLPFIFMNAVGLNNDMFTLLHEGGHSFHTMLSRNDPMYSFYHAPMEFCEVASMAMEHLALPYLNVFYDEKSAVRATREHLEGDLSLLPWVAIVDAFQHWIYTHPDHTNEERADYWVSLMERFSSGVDYTGFEDTLKYRWHAQLHIFEVPFYYIEYGIALLGALQVWHNSREDQPKAIAAYKHALSLGGSKTLPELFEAANAKFDFSGDTIKPLMDDIDAELTVIRELDKK